MKFEDKIFLAENPNTPPETLVKLSKDKNVNVLNTLLCRRRKLPLEAWINLSDCGNTYIKKKLLETKELPDIVRLKLIEI